MKFEANYHAQIMIDGKGFGVDSSCEIEADTVVEAYKKALAIAAANLHKNHKNSVDNLYPLRFDIQLKNIKTNGTK